MKFTKEQQDYIKNACEHIEVLTGGRGHSKTKKVIEDMQQEIERLNNIIKNIKSQLDYLETYSSKEDVFEDMKRRLDRIESIIGDDKE